VTRFQEERVSAFCVVITDLTEQKRQTAAAAAEDAWRDADRRKNEFLAILGHELRNPLAAIANSVQILDQLGPHEERLVWARDVIRRQVQHLGRIVDDLLDVSRITTGKIELRREAIDVCALVSRIADGYRPIFEQRRRRLALSIPPGPLPVHADPTRLAQVVSNLIDNAVKFTGEGGLVAVTVSRREDRAVLTVRDTGIGISLDLLPRIFDLFTQGLRPGPQTGLGIGLALVRQLVEIQEGTIQARSKGPGHGSEFEVSFPIFRGSEQAESGKDAAATSALARPERILIVEDHVDSAEGLATLLRLDGHDVKAVYDGSSALSCAAQFRPETVLVDIGLPEMDGYEVARRLRDILSAEALIIALTGYGQAEDRRRSAEAMIDHHVLKPVRIDVIAELMKKSRESGPRG
jgi:CheY-like chemotaxis protein